MAATRRILVIDHSPEGRTRIVEPLRAAGHEVTVAASAADGAATFGRFDPHLVFIAARLPRTHGTILCRELKRTSAGSNCKIVLVVEAAEVQIDLPPLDHFGADHLLRMPVGTDEIMGVVQALLPQDAAASLDEPNPEKYGLAELEENDDGLSNALEELDTLDFDLPEEILKPPAEPKPDPPVPLSDDRGEDIQDHLDDLFNEAPTAPEPVMGQDTEIDELLQEELGVQSRRSTARTTTPTPTPTPTPTSTSDATQQSPVRQEKRTPVSPPAAIAAPAATRYQTEAVVQRKPQPAPSTTAVTTAPRAPIGRWSLAAISATVIVVALAAAWGTRGRDAAADSFATTPLASQESGSPQGIDSASTELIGPPQASLLPAVIPTEVEDESVAAVAAQVDKQDEARREDPIVKKVEPITKPIAKPVVAAPTQRVTQPASKPTVEEAAVALAPNPKPEPIPEPEPEVEPEAVSDEPQVAATPTPEDSSRTVEEEISEPALNFEIELPKIEPLVEPEAAVEPRTPVAEPISREALLIQRVEPRVTPKDLKKGRGTIVLKVLVSSRGTVSRVLIEQGIPGSPVEAAAVSAVLRWRYEPALESDVAIESWVRAEFNFE
jgi:protein TonB